MKVFFTLLFFVLLPLLGFSETGKSFRDEGLGLSAGAVLMPGLFYADQFEPGYSGTGLFFSARYDWKPVSLHATIEAAFSPIGAQILLPINVSKTLMTDYPLKIDVSGGVLPGLALFKPYPLFVIGGEAGFNFHYALNASTALTVGVFIRVTTCPEYTKRVALYNSWDIPIKIGVDF